MAVTSNPLDALLFYMNGHKDWRWNFTQAEGGKSFAAGVGEAVRITYSFPQTKPAYADETGFRAFGAAEKGGVRAVMDAIEAVCNVDFVEVPRIGDITFAWGSISAAAHAYAPFTDYYVWSNGLIDDVSMVDYAGDVWFNRLAVYTADEWKPGGGAFWTMMHEMGHSLGLKHPFDGENVLPASLNNVGNTVMAYGVAPEMVVWDYNGVSVDAYWLYPSTPMVMDIRALQFLYGANTDTHSGNTTHKWLQNEELFETIWDGGGIDTIDCSNQVLDCVINLNPGKFSSIAQRKTDAQVLEALGVPSNYTVTEDVYRGQNNLAIAYDTIIENATGGSGHDRIIGNRANNKLAGGGGNDVLTGGAGKDRLSGGAGNDVFDFNKKMDLGTVATRTDTVLDYVSGMDRLDLAGIDANDVKAGNQAFSFLGSRNFSADATGQLRFSGGVLYGSTDKDRDAEFTINLAGVTGLTAADIIL
ncbi:MAG: putative Serralysin precursor [Ramlibacter sp.]|jgi:serralysin|nr:putative Serralysin precursor [Ramlibacter sp.]